MDEQHLMPLGIAAIEEDPRAGTTNRGAAAA
jgi:hypothetical protein